MKRIRITKNIIIDIFDDLNEYQNSIIRILLDKNVLRIFQGGIFDEMPTKERIVFSHFLRRHIKGCNTTKFKEQYNPKYMICYRVKYRFKDQYLL